MVALDFKGTWIHAIQGYQHTLLLHCKDFEEKVGDELLGTRGIYSSRVFYLIIFILFTTFL